MKTGTLSLFAMVLGLTLTVPALAQETMKYDPIMEKRVDLRLKWIHAQKVAAESPLRMHRRNGTDNEASVVKDRPDLVDFMARLPKRGDLRLRANKIGIEAAYDEWKAKQSDR